MKHGTLFLLLLLMPLSAGVAGDNIFKEGEIAVIKSEEYSFCDGEKFILNGDSRKYLAVPEKIPQILSIINSSKKFNLQIKSDTSGVYVYQDTSHGVVGKFVFLKNQPGEIMIYGHGTYEPPNSFFIKVAKIVTLGLLKFPVYGRGVIDFRYKQNDEKIKHQIIVCLETDNRLANKLAKYLAKRFYRQMILKALKDGLAKYLDSMELSAIGIEPFKEKEGCHE